MSDRFRNPYNFVPVGDASRIGQLSDDNPLGQGKPKGHHRYHEGHWNGRIGINIEVATPLLIPDAAKEDRSNDHAILAPLTYAHKVAGGSLEERPLLPVTSFKGPLRATYEAVTNSRMGVFGTHAAPLGRRMTAYEGLAMVPARIIKHSSGFAVELWMGDTNVFPKRQVPKERWILPGNPPSYAAWIRSYDKNRPGRSVAAIGYEGATKTGHWPEHGDEVYCWIQLWEKRLPRPVAYWRVVEIAKDLGKLSTSAPTVAAFGRHTPVVGQMPRVVRGFVVASNNNTENRREERVFFAPTMTVLVPDEDQEQLENRWRQLIADYREQHREEIVKRKKAKTHEKLTHKYGPALSRHLYHAPDTWIACGDPFDPSRASHKTGTLCYARLEEDAKGNGLPIIKDLYPVMISRDLGFLTPRQMLHENLRPATRLDNLSPADRVFGWVRQSGRGYPGAWRGQLRMHPIRCETPAAQALQHFKDATGKRTSLPLTILSTPKVAQARFYIGKANGEPLGTKSGSDYKNAKTHDDAYFEQVAAGKKPSKSLRGRKVYPHHHFSLTQNRDGYWDWRGAIADAKTLPTQPAIDAASGKDKKTGNDLAPTDLVDWTSPYREYVRRQGYALKTEKKQGQNHFSIENVVNADDQNRSIRAWITPKTIFTDEIDVVNMNEAELGALLWLLDLPYFCRENKNAYPADKKEEAALFHRIGGGKPLGFGSILVTLTSLEVSNGEAICNSFGSLMPQSDADLRRDGGQVALGNDQKAAREHAQRFVDKYTSAIAKRYADDQTSFDKVAFIAAFRQAARGYDDDLPAHYPRTDEHQNPSGENFEWFTSNNRSGRYALPALDNDDGLPLDPGT